MRHHILFLVTLISAAVLPLTSIHHEVSAISTHTHTRGHARRHGQAQQVLDASLLSLSQKSGVDVGVGASVGSDVSGGIIASNTSWPAGTRLLSASGGWSLELKSTGMSYPTVDPTTTWAVTYNNPFMFGNSYISELFLQPDCNLILRGYSYWNTKLIQRIWDSQTAGHGKNCYLQLDNQGKFMIRDGNGTIVRLLASPSATMVRIYGAGDDYYYRCGTLCTRDDTYVSCYCPGPSGNKWTVIRWSDCVIDTTQKLGLILTNGQLSCSKSNPCSVSRNPCNTSVTDTGSPSGSGTVFNGWKAGNCIPSSDYSTATCSCAVIPEGYPNKIQYGGPRCDIRLPLGSYASGCDLSTCSMSGPVITCTCAGKVQSLNTDLCHLTDPPLALDTSCSAVPGSSTCRSVTSGVLVLDGLLQCSVARSCYPVNSTGSVVALCPDFSNEVNTRAVCVPTPDMKSPARCNCINNGYHKHYGKWCEIDGNVFTGDWYKSCDVSTCTASGSVLSCTCNNIAMSLDFSLCYGPAIIVNGRWMCRTALVCAMNDPCTGKGACIPSADQRTATCSSTLPNGQYSATCKDCTVSGGVLTCSCPTGSDSTATWVSNSLTLSNCGSQRGPRYAYGKLVCDAPLTSDCPNCGPFRDSSSCNAVKGCKWNAHIIRGAPIYSCDQNIAGITTDPVDTILSKVQAMCRADPSGSPTIVMAIATNIKASTVQAQLTGSGKSWCPGDSITCYLYDTTSRKFLSDGCSFIGRNTVTGDAVCSCIRSTASITTATQTTSPVHDVDIRCCSQRPSSSCSSISGCSWSGNKCTDTDSTLLPGSYKLYNIQMQLSLTLKASKGVTACKYTDSYNDDQWRLTNAQKAIRTFTISKNNPECTNSAALPSASCSYVLNNNGKWISCTTNKIDNSNYQCVCSV